MLFDIKKILYINFGITETHRLICAVSGGIDSMVLAHCVHGAGLPLGIAHVHHHTRGEENELDAELVQYFCSERAIPYYQLDFYWDNKGNFHEAARKARYAFFNQVASNHGYDYIATAHHEDDAIESFLLNIMRGTGIKGMQGMPSVYGNIIRPLLGITRQEVHAYAAKNKVNYRDDSSNNELKYTRNKVRQLLLPAMEQLDSRARKGLKHTIQNAMRESSLLEFVISNHYPWLKRWNYHFILKDSLPQDEQIAAQILYQKAAGYGFNFQQILDLHTSHLVNSKIISQSHILVNEEDRYTLALNQEISYNTVIDGVGSYIMGDWEIIVTENPVGQDGANYFHFDSQPFPFIIRSRQEGDSFKPLGMGGKSKRVKKYLTDSGCDFIQKREALVVEYQDEIIGVLDKRVSEKCKYLPGRTRFTISVNRLFVG